MKIDRLKEINELLEIQDKIEAIFEKKFTRREMSILLEMLENSEKLFMDIIHEALDKADCVVI